MAAILDCFKSCKKKVSEEHSKSSGAPQPFTHRVMPSTMSFDLDTAGGQLSAIQALRGHSHQPSSIDSSQVPGSVPNKKDDARKARRLESVEIINAQSRVRLSLP